MPTIKDVAKKAGLSIATVSRVLNMRGPLSEKTIAKVNKAMEDLNYQPNLIARTLVKGRRYCIGVMMPDIAMPFWSKMAHELMYAASQYGYNIMVTDAPREKEAYIRKYECLRSSMPDGIITSYTMDTEEHLYKSAVPTVILGNASYKWSVSSNDEQGGLLATRHLIAKGCKRLIHVSGELKSRSSGNARSFAFIQECERQHIAYKVYETNKRQLTDMDFAGVISDVFSEEQDFDGIFASNDILAAHCVSTALSLGYRIPDDIRIVGYDDINISSILYPPLTTIRQNFRLLAATAVETLLQAIDGKEIPEKQIIPVELVERKTT